MPAGESVDLHSHSRLYELIHGKHQDIFSAHEGIRVGEMEQLLSRAERLQEHLAQDQGALRAIERRTTELHFRMDSARTELMLIIGALDKLLAD